LGLADVLQTESRAAFDSLGWTVNPVENDYGVDFEVEVFKNRQSTGLTFKVQLKSSKCTDYSSDTAYVSQGMERASGLYMQYPFILPISDTSLQAGINIANIKHELETNELLKQDYGTFQFGDVDDPVPEPSFESEEEWQARNLLLSNDVRVLARSREQKIRGLKHRQYRPRLAIIDDPEDIEWVRTKENRDKTEQWLNSEVIPGLDKQQRKLIILINNLHMDALAARVKANQ
jgi:hypothetical protein